MKNLSLIDTTIQGIKSWRLLDNDGKPIDYFDSLNNILIKKYSTNTRLSYCRNIALFIDYLEEVNNIYSHEIISQSFLVDVIEAFPEWLLYGKQSGNEIVIKINKSYPSPTYSRASVDLIITSVRLFISISEKIRLTQEVFEEHVENKLFENLNITDSITTSTKKNLIKKSLLSGVIAGGPKLLKVCILPIKKSQSYFSTERAFPFDKIIPFINSLTSYRDKALYMFCAASGCRIHEALQILIEDISIKDRSIRLVDPFSRITNKTYTILSAQEKTKLSWKGRQTDRTILIQPFGDLFFEYLEKYIKEEYGSCL